MTIRARLALSYGVAMVVMTLFIVGIVWLQVGATLRGSLDQSLRVQAANALAALDDEDHIDELGDEPERPSDVFIALFDRAGELLDATANTPLAVRAHVGPISSGDLADEQGRYAVDVLVDDELHVAVLAGGSLTTLDATVNDVTRALALVGAAAVLLSLAAGWWLAGRALRPISMLTDEAALIGSTDLDARLPLPAVHDELGVLAETLNGMIERLADGLRRERGFVAGASHQLRTPLAALQAELELATDEGVSPQEVRAAVEAALSDTVRLAELTSGLLSLAAAEADGREVLRAPVEISSLVDSAVRQVESRARQRRVTIKTAVPDGQVRVDRLRLEQAIVNLLVNAIAYGPEGGLVELKMRIDADAHTDRGGGRLVVEVLDRGPGIPDDLATRIFEPFQRGPNRGVDGAGLGLATAAAAAKAHHGTIGFEGREGGGSCFWLDLPQ